jgi:ABC-type transport system involved in multi-copper enzyme maturation permease subunit
MKTNKRAHRSASIWQLLLNELYKLWRHRLVWVLLALDLVAVLFSWLALVYAVIKTPGSFTADHLLGGPNGLANAISWPTTLSRRALEVIAVALGAVTFGGEFSSGSIRLIFSRGMGRTTYLVAKFLALAVAGAAVVLVGMVTSLLLVNVLVLVNPAAPTLLEVNGSTVGILSMLYLGMLETCVFCLLLGAALGIMSRSAAIGVVAGCGWLIGEDLLARWLQMNSTSLHTDAGLQIAAFLFTPNLNAFYQDTLPPQLAAMVSPLSGVLACNPTAGACSTSSAGQAVLISLVWALILSLVSIYLVTRRDVLQ